MPIISYIAYPEINMKQELIAALENFDNCEVTPADNKDVVIVVTDTPDENSNEILHEKIKALDSLQSITMTFGHSD